MLKVTDNLFLVLTALLMIAGLIIALMMRRSGARRDDSDDESLASNDQAVKEQIERKIGGLDLNLDSEQPALKADALRTKPR